MKEQEIIDGNKLIAEFMGFEYTSIPPFVDHWFKNGISVGELQFHSDWNWLMGVVAKIEFMGIGVTIHLSQVLAHGYISEDQEKPFDHKELYGKKIESVFKTVLSFIKWYNTQLTLPPSNPMGDK